MEKAVERGARQETVRVVTVEVVPLAYIANGAMRVVVKAVGELGLERIEDKEDDVEEKESAEDEGVYEGSVQPQFETEHGGAAEEVDYENYKPQVIGEEWVLSETDLREFVSANECYPILHTCLIQSSSWKDAGFLEQ
jgi:hypothetical protein